MQAAGTEAAFEDAIFSGEEAQRVFDDCGVERETFRNFAQRERAVGAGIAADEFEDGMCDRFKQSGSETGRQRNAEGVAIAGCIFSGDEATLACDAELEKAARAHQPGQRFEQERVGDATRDFVLREIAEAQTKIVNAVCRSGAMGLSETLRGFFHLGDGVGIEQFAEVSFAEQLAELVLIDGEGLCAALGEGRIAVVEEVGYIAEEERRGKGRWLAGIDHMDAELALLNGAEGFNERGHVEYVAETFAIGLEQQRERRIARCDAEQIVGALAQLPKRRTGIGAAAGKKERTACCFAKTAGEESGSAELAQDELHGLS